MVNYLQYTYYPVSQEVNRTTKFCQLMEYSMINIFSKIHTQNLVNILFPGSFLKSQNWAYYWINSLKFLYSLFLLYDKVKDYQNISKLSSWPRVFTSYWLNNKKSSWTSLSTCIIFTLHSIDWPNFIVCLSLLLEILGNMCIVITFFPSLCR